MGSRAWHRLMILFSGALLPLCGQTSLNERVLVVYNASVSDSLAVARHYMEQRQIPESNRCRISVESTDYLKQQEYESRVKTPVRRCIEALGKQKILYIVFSYQTPYVVTIGDRGFALDSNIADIWDEYSNSRPGNEVGDHPYFGEAQSQGNVYAPFVPLAAYRDLPRAANLYSVWRLDAANANLAKGLVDKALYAETHGLSGKGCFVLLRLHHRHVAQVTVKLIVVETEADDEAVGNLETAELHGDLDEPAGIAVQESAHGQRVGAAAGERLQKVAQRQSGIHDILHQQHIFVFDAIVQILGDAHDARRAGFVREGGDGQKIDLYRNLNVARQRGEKEHRALEHTHQLERLAPVALADFHGHLLDALRNLLFGEQDAFDTRRVLAHGFAAHRFALIPLLILWRAAPPGRT